MTVSEIRNLFREFKGREEGLKKVTRYSLYPVMFYRTDLWAHTLHVHWITLQLAKRVKSTHPEFNTERAATMALVHDDHELFLGDIQAGLKLRMNKEEKENLKNSEIHAIDQVSDSFPKTVNGYEYRSLLIEAMNAETLESQIVKLADRLDAFGEALHELYAGNMVFAVSVGHERGDIPTPADFYVNWLEKIPSTFPELAVLWNKGEVLFSTPERLDWKHVAEEGSPATIESLSTSSHYPHYGEWLSIVLKNSDDELIAKLVTKAE
ncbi:MAG: putative oxetanocin-like protein [Patescibacteria group bacterium]|nr:putative oxetanocin-like protein [Patescibacteria group bacterium]